MRERRMRVSGLAAKVRTESTRRITGFEKVKSSRPCHSGTTLHGHLRTPFRTATMTPETSPTPGIKRTSHVELTPGRKEGQHSVWDALTGIFEDLDRQGGGAEAEELEDTLDELRGLLEMHTQLRGKAVELEAMRLEVTRERDAALSMLYELEEETSPRAEDPFDAREEAVGETNEPEADDVGEDGGKPYDDVYYSASGAALPSVR